MKVFPQQQQLYHNKAKIPSQGTKRIADNTITAEIYPNIRPKK